MNEYAEFIWLRSEIQSLLIEQPIYEIFGSDAVIGGIKPRFKRQDDFFVVITDVLQRCKFPVAYILTHHRLCHLDILFIIGCRCNKVHFGAADLADRYIITPAKQFKVNDIFDGMTAVAITEAQQIIAKADVNNIVFSQRAEVCLSLDVKALDLIEKIAFQ